MERFGSTYYTRLVGGRKIIMSAEPEVARHVLQKNHRNYEKSELQTESLGQYVGQGLLTSNGAFWLRQRRLIQPGFHRERLEGLLQIMNDEINQYKTELAQRLENGSLKVDLAAEMMQLTLRVVSRALFSTGISQEQLSFLNESFTILQRHIIKEVRQPVFNWIRRINGKKRRALSLSGQVRELMKDIIMSRKRMKEEDMPDDLLTMLLSTRYEDSGEPMSMTQLLDELLIIFVAGHETTANSLTWTFYLLSQDKAYIEKVRSESERVFEKALSLDSLSVAMFSQQSINESLRLYPPAWIIDRKPLKADQVGSLKISAGDLVGIYVYGIHREKSLWPHPHEFRPERFRDMPSSSLFTFFPFGGGPRLCIGNHFAMMEMQLVVLQLWSAFDFTYLEKDKPALEPLITLRPKGGMPMKVSLA